MTTNHNDPGYEKRDVGTGKVAFFGISGIIVLVVVIFIIFDYFSAVKEELVYESVLRPESAALRILRARETEELTSYAIVDEANGVYRVPIKRAMELIAEEEYRKRLKQSQK